MTIRNETVRRVIIGGLCCLVILSPVISETFFSVEPKKNNRENYEPIIDDNREVIIASNNKMNIQNRSTESINKSNSGDKNISNTNSNKRESNSIDKNVSNTNSNERENNSREDNKNVIFTLNNNKEQQNLDKTIDIKSVIDEYSGPIVTKNFVEGDILSDEQFKEDMSNFNYTDDVDLLARVIYSEAGNQSYEGMLAVGDVVMNRCKVNSQTVKEVIFDKNQFDGVKTHWFFDPPSVDCINAAKEVLNGKNIIPDAYFYCNLSICKQPNWANSKTFIRKIGDHSFYRYS